MSKEQRWILSDALGLMLHISRACCLAPVHFVVTHTETFVYMSRPLFFFNLVVVTIIHLCTIYCLYSFTHIDDKDNFNNILLETSHLCIIKILLSTAVLNSDTRIRNYIICFTNLKKVIKSFHNTEKRNIKKYHVIIIFIVSSGGINIVLLIGSLMSGAFNYFSFLLMLEYTMAGIYQQQFVFFALHINLALNLIQEELQVELAKLMIDDEKQLGDITITRANIPLTSINKVIDMIGRTDIFLPNLRHTPRQDVAQRIRKIKDCYVSTCDTLGKLNISDNVLLFLQIIYFSLTMVLSSYKIINLMRQDDSLNLLVNCLQFVFLIIQIIMLVEPCHEAAEKIAKIRLLVCEMTCYVSSEVDPIAIEMRAFFNQFISNNVSYTALEIFNIGRPLIASIIGGVTTVLTMIFEF